MIEVLPRQFVEKPWGRTDLPLIFDVGDSRIGEVWFDRIGQPLPVLVKWLFTSERLSIQVHPNDRQAVERGLVSGKEECWFVVEAEDDARLGIGLHEAIGPEDLRAASLSGDIERLMDWKPVKPGDWFFIPAGTVHAIGAGIKLVEIQQNADVTYRLYDYGRPRELHLDDGVAVSVAGPYNGKSGSLPAAVGRHRIFDGAHFIIDCLQGAGEHAGDAEGDVIYVPIVGQFAIGADTIGPGQAAYGSAEQLFADCDAAMMLVCRTIT